MTGVPSRVLLCEINRKNQADVAAALTDQNHTVDAVTDGHEALDAVAARSYDLVILAADIPSIDGYQVCRLIKESDRTRNVPVMIMSSDMDHMTRVRAIESGADEFLLLPLNRVELAARVLTLVRQKALQEKLERQIAENEAERAKLARKNTELRVLSEVARFVLSVKDQRKALRDMLTLIASEFEFGGCCLFSCDLQSWRVEAISESLPSELVGKLFPQVEILDSCRKQEKPIWVDDCARDARTPREFVQQFGVGIRSMISCPVSVRGETIGILLMVGKTTYNVDIGLLMTLSGQVALAMENIQLFTKLSDFNLNLQNQIGESTRALEELTQFNDSILQSIGSGIMTVDSNEIVTFLNRTGESILSTTSEEVVGQALSAILGSVPVSKVLSATSEDSIQGAELELRLPAGKRIYLGFRTNKRLTREGQEAGYIIHFRDISQVREMRETMYRMDRLVSLGMLTSGIAHEIRNPLAGIKTMAQALEKEMPADDHRTEYVQRIVKQINRLNDLLKSFFSYARPLKPNREYCDLRSIVGDITTLLKSRMVNENITIEEYYDPKIPRLYVDGNQIEQVLMNLFINALDSMKPYGVLTFSAVRKQRNIPPYFFDPRDVVEITVHDTGAGIKQEHLSAIFDPFFTTKPNGTGLGLSIVYRIIHEHHGHIEVQSELGKGTTFLICLPLTEKAMPTDSLETPAKAGES